MFFEPKKNLVLIGGRGCGKSSVARRIKQCNRHFTLFELDALIRYEAGGLTIPEIVDLQGWPHFRDLEYEVVRKVSAFRSGALIDAGGGVVVDLDASGNEAFSQRKVDALKQHSLVVYLQRDVDYLIDRIKGDHNRPSLSDTASFKEIMQRRDPWYRAAADIVIKGKRRSKQEITSRILSWFQQQTEPEARIGTEEE